MSKYVEIKLKIPVLTALNMAVFIHDASLMYNKKDVNGKPIYGKRLRNSINKKAKEMLKQISLQTKDLE